MTRLKAGQIRDIGRNLKDYDELLIKKTGRTMKQIAMRAAGISDKQMENALRLHSVAVVPITSGQGIIEGFTGAVQDILNYMGAKVFQTTATDVAGLAEAVKRGAEIVFCADDQRFVALDLIRRRIVDNAEATAKGYVEALQCMAKDLTNQEVLVIGGAGRVGWNAAMELKKKGARVSIYDINLGRLALYPSTHGVRVEEDLKRALQMHRVLFDVSSAVDLIGAEHIRPETIIAAPGIPLGLTEEAYALVEDHLVHDPLQIGVATMLVEAISTTEKSAGG